MSFMDTSGSLSAGSAPLWVFSSLGGEEVEKGLIGGELAWVFPQTLTSVYSQLLPLPNCRSDVICFLGQPD